MNGATAGVRPRKAQGYATAAARGLLPPVPPEPPRPRPGATAWQTFRTFVVGIVAAAVLAVVVVRLVRRLVPGPLGDVAMLAAGLAWFALVLLGRAAVGRASLRELEHGYTTLVLTLGNFGWGGGQYRIPWDYHGTWVLDGSGRRVVAPPDREVEPPGFYPSPNRPGAWELWTGAVWAGHFRDEP